MNVYHSKLFTQEMFIGTENLPHDLEAAIHHA